MAVACLLHQRSQLLSSPAGFTASRWCQADRFLWSWKGAKVLVIQRVSADKVIWEAVSSLESQWPMVMGELCSTNCRLFWSIEVHHFARLGFPGILGFLKQRSILVHHLKKHLPRAPLRQARLAVCSRLFK